MKVLLSIKPEFVQEIFTGKKKYEYRKDIDGYIIKGENGEYKFTEYDACELFNKRILIKYYDELIL